MCQEAWMDSDIPELMFVLQRLLCTAQFTRCSARRRPFLCRFGPNSMDVDTVSQVLSHRQCYLRDVSLVFPALQCWQVMRNEGAGSMVLLWT